MDLLQRTLLTKLLPPLFALAVILLLTRRRGVPWREGLGLSWPRAPVVAAWFAIWIAWMAVGEVIIQKLGLAQPAPWPDYPPLVFGLRVLAIGLVGPLAEELVVRGLFFYWMRRTPLGTTGAILVGAAAWAAAHVAYDWETIGLIFADGVLLGVCRARSRSVLLPAALHALANLFSIWQSTLGAR